MDSHYKSVFWGRYVSSPAIWATKISAHFGDNNVAQISRRLNGQKCSHTPSALNAGATRSGAWNCHASMLLLGEGSDAFEEIYYISLIFLNFYIIAASKENSTGRLRWVAVNRLNFSYRKDRGRTF